MAEGAGYDMLAERDGAVAEVACETVSAEAGRKVNRGDWWMLVDRIYPELQTWLAGEERSERQVPRTERSDIVAIGEYRAGV